MSCIYYLKENFRYLVKTLIVLSPFFVKGMVSGLDLCADQWIEWLFEKDEITSLSSYSQKYPVHKGIESLISKKPLIVIADSFLASSTKKILEQKGIQVKILTPLYSFEDIKKRLNFFLIFFKTIPTRQKKIKHALKELENIKKNSSPYSTGFFLSAGGLVAGQNTLLTDQLNALGIRNPLQFTGWRYLSIEKALDYNPDIVVSSKGSSKIFLINADHSSLKNAPIKRVYIKRSLCFVPTPETIASLKKNYSISNVDRVR